MTRQTRPALVIVVIAILVGIAAATRLSDHVRWVDIVTLFRSGFGAGAGVVSAIARMRMAGRYTG